MNTSLGIARFEARDVLRGRWLAVYGFALFGLAQTLVSVEGDVTRAMAGLVNAALLIVPLVSLLFGTLHLYGTRDFNRLLLAQPVGRRELFAGLVIGTALPLVAVTLVSLGVPLGIAAVVDGAPGGGAGVARFVAVVGSLAFVGVALAFFLAMTVRDRAAGMGAAVLVWLTLTILYDGLFVAAALALPNTLLERPALVATLLNPVDTARILLLMQFDTSALLGYTGAVYRSFFGGIVGSLIGAAALAAWVVGPLALARRQFLRSDL